MGCATSSLTVVSPVLRRKHREADIVAMMGPFPSETMDSSNTDILGKYRMSLVDADILGEGSSSICRKGVEIQTGKSVAVKVYKDSQVDHHVELFKFQRQVDVLQELARPWKIPEKASLWCDQLSKTEPSQLFVNLLDYSKGVVNGQHYLITEQGSYTLRDYIAFRRTQTAPLSQSKVRGIIKAIIVVMAGLHAKCLVHIDVKPENLMIFGTLLKLIDVDGCVPVGSRLARTDATISFSPCYCAPEFARFLVEDDEVEIVADSALDVFSVGLTICELVSQKVALKDKYDDFAKLPGQNTNRQFGVFFMHWLGDLRVLPLPPKVVEFDGALQELLSNGLLVCDSEKRSTLAECLASPYFDKSVSKNKASAGETTKEVCSSPNEHWSVASEAPGRCPNITGIDFPRVRLGRDQSNDQSTSGKGLPVHKDAGQTVCDLSS